ncbi:MAG: 30S ribosomal protein S2 [Deltaproteobacteria bacterium]|nr:30S ribosomal protein S2 [Deltaproteobacteria bacterium]
MAYLTMKQLLEAGVHFGHQTKRWNPKMKPYIFGARNGIYIVDLQQTVKAFKIAYDYIRDVAAKGQKVLFIGTKKQAQNSIEQAANKCGMDYINQRWIGGLLTNFSTIKQNIDRLKKLSAIKDGASSTEAVTKKEALLLERERVKLEKNIGGIRNMTKLPGAVFVIDSKKETIALKEARRLGIPIVAIVDTNCDPDEVDIVVPGNDDAIRAIDLFANAMAEACMEGKALYEQKLVKETDKAVEAKAAAEIDAKKAAEEAAVAEGAPV